MALAKTQHEAVATALSVKVMVITGGPGVGKTTIVRSILQVVAAKGVKIALAAPTGRAAKRLSESTGLLDCHVLPKLGNRLVPDLAYGDINQIHSDLVKAGKRVTANRVRSLLSRLLNIAAKEGWIEKGLNPVSMVERAKEVPSDRTFKPIELSRLHAALQAFREKRSMDPAILEAVYFCAFSGLRRSEVLRLEWSDVDTEESTVTIRDHKRSGTVGAMVLPLNSHMASVVERRKQDAAHDRALAEKEGRTYSKPEPIFASARTGEPQKGFSKSWQRVMAAAAIVGATPHDLRRTFSTTCMELGTHPAIADLLLGHSLGRIRDTYNVIGSNGILAEASQKTANKILEFINSPSEPGVVDPAKPL